MDTESQLHKVMTSRGINHRKGDLFMDAPLHDTVEALTDIAKDRRQWRIHVEELAGNGKFDTEKANTPAETAAAIAALPDDATLAHTDGGCDGNGAKGEWGAAGGGAWICSKSHTALADLWGPVVVDPVDTF